MFMNLMYFLITLIPILINVAFITLFERKILGYSQNRKGPNKVLFMGIFQPFSDAIKLFSKENIFPNLINWNFFFFSPIFLMMMMLTIWLILPSKQNFINSELSIILFISILSLGIYPLFFSGWSSNSKYSIIGAIRAISQTISYEISLAMIFLILINLMMSLNFLNINKTYFFYTSIFFSAPVLILWLVSCVAETNRTPFDFAEGESELVSGFNIEYSSFLFAILFMSEYGMILMFAMLSSMIFFSSIMNLFSIILFLIILTFFWIWLRATYPRFRYDKLMSLGWKFILPLVIFQIFYFTLFSLV